MLPSLPVGICFFIEYINFLWVLEGLTGLSVQQHSLYKEVWMFSILYNLKTLFNMFVLPLVISVSFLIISPCCLSFWNHRITWDFYLSIKGEATSSFSCRAILNVCRLEASHKAWRCKPAANDWLIEWIQVIQFLKSHDMKAGVCE